MIQAVRHTLLAYEPEDEAARPLVLPIREAEAAMGETVEAFLRRVAWHFDLPTVCRINGVYYARAEWGLTHFCANDNIEFLSRPLGGAGGGGNSAAKSIGAIVALVALTAIAPYVVAGLGGAVGAGASVGTATALTLTGRLAASVLVGGGALAISHFLKPKPAVKTAAKNDIYSFAFGGNAARPLEPIPEWFGRNLAHPDYAAPRYSEYIGDSMIEYALLCVGRGKYDIEELRVANTTIWSKAGGVVSEFPGIQVAFYGPGEQVTLFPVNVVTSSEVSGAQLTGTSYVGGFVANAAGTTTKELLIDFVWPSGSYVSYKDRILPPQTGITIEGVQVDDSGVQQGYYQTLLTRAYSFAKQSQIRVTERIAVSEGRWKVRVRRTNPPISGGLGSGQSGTDDVVWSALRAHIEGPQVYDRVTTIAIKATANASLAGFTNGQLGVIATRILPTWNSTTSQFVEAPTRSIAWAAMYMWRDAYNGNQSLTQVDFQSFIDYNALWTSLGHTFDFIFKSPMALDEAMETILRAGRAYPAHIGDQISIVRDEPRSIPRMLFTDYDIVRGSLEIDYSLANEELADGMVGEYIDETTLRVAEVSSAPDGVVLAKPKRVQLPGASKRAQAAGLIRFQAAENQYRRITASWTARAEGRSLKRGDLVLLSCEEPETWGQSCEVLAYDDANRILTLDPAPAWEATGLHYVEVRRRDGQPWGPVRVTRGASDALAIVNATDLATEDTRQGMALFDAVSRTATMDRPTVAFSPGQPRSFRVLITEGDPDMDGEHMHLRGVLDAPEVYAVTETGVPPLASIPTIFASGLPVVNKLSATAYQRHASLVLQAGWEPARFAVTYGAEISADGGLTWLPAYAGDSTTFEATISGATSVKVRVRGFNAALTPGPYSVTGDIAVPNLVISGEHANLLIELDDVSQHVKDILIGLPSVDGSIAAAKKAGDDAYLRGTAAYNRAGDALNAADAAFREAQNQGSAADALANAAQGRADAAFTAAGNANTAAGTALTAANTAQTAANTAFAAASDAATAASTRFAEMLRAVSARPADRVAIAEPTLRALREDLDFIASSMADMQGRMNTAHSALIEAGLEFTSSEGKARIYGLSQLRDDASQKISAVQVSLDAVRGQVLLLASIGQTGDLSGLIKSITDLQIRLDAVDKAIDLRVTTAVFSPLATRVSTAEVTISNHDTAINARATVVDVNAIGARVTDAETAINAQRGEITSAITDLRSATAGTDFSIESINLLLDNLDRRAGLIAQDLAKASQTLGARVLDNGDVIAKLGVDLVALTADTSARFTSETSARATAISAEVTARQGLAAVVYDPVTGLAQTRTDLASEQTTRSTGDTTLGNSISGINSVINDPNTGLAKAHSNIFAEATTRATNDTTIANSVTTLSTQVNHPDTGLPKTLSRLQTEEQTRSTAVSGVANRTTNLETEVYDARQGSASVGARLIVINNARATADDAITNTLNSLASQVNHPDTGLPRTVSRITSEETTRASADTALGTSITNIQTEITGARQGSPDIASRLTILNEARATGDAALSTSISTLSGQVNNADTGLPQAVTRLTTEETTRATADTALGTSITNIQTEVTGARQGESTVGARLTVINQARVTGDAGLATAISTLNSQVNNVDTGLPKTFARLVTEEKARADGDTAVVQTVTNLLADFTPAGQAGLSTRIGNEETARANADTAIGTRIGYIESEVQGARQGSPDVASRLTVINQARADGDTAISTSLTTLSGVVNNPDTGLAKTASRITDEATARALDVKSVADRTQTLETEVSNAREGKATLRAHLLDISKAITDGDTTVANSVSSLGTIISDPVTGLARTYSRLGTEETTRSTEDARIEGIANSASTVATSTQGEVVAARQGLGTLTARFLANQNAQVQGDQALTNNINGVYSQVNNPTTGLPQAHSRITDEATTRANDVSSVASTASLIQTEVINARQGLPTLMARISANQSAQTQGDQALTDLINGVYSQVNNPTTGLPQTRSDLTSEVSTRSTLTSAFSTSITNLQTEVANARQGEGSIAARLNVINQARADGDTAVALTVTNLRSDFNTDHGTLTTTANSVNGIKVSYGVIGNINGVTGGFVFSGVKRLDGGVTYQLELDGNLLVNGSVKARHLAVETLITSSAQIGSLTVDNLQINNSAVSQILSATGANGASVSVTVTTKAQGSGKVVVIASVGGYATPKSDNYMAPLNIQAGSTTVFTAQPTWAYSQGYGYTSPGQTAHFQHTPGVNTTTTYTATWPSALVGNSVCGSLIITVIELSK